MKKGPGKIDISGSIRRMLIDLGINTQAPDFKDTPDRVSRMYNEFFEGIRPEAKQELKDILGASFPSKNDAMVIVKGIRIYSLCPHHLQVVTYDITIGYIPKGHVLGLSKFARVSELLGRQPILQESLTDLIADTLHKSLKCAGVIVIAEGVHGCMTNRGVKQQNAKVLTSAIRGEFVKPIIRQEFLNLAK